MTQNAESAPRRIRAPFGSTWLDRPGRDSGSYRSGGRCYCPARSGTRPSRSARQPAALVALSVSSGCESVVLRHAAQANMALFRLRGLRRRGRAGHAAQELPIRRGDPLAGPVARQGLPVRDPWPGSSGRESARARRAHDDAGPPVGATLLDPAGAGVLLDAASRRIWTPQGKDALGILYRRGLTDATIRRAGWGSFLS